ncbi:hypothetical protein OQ727_07075, partial [Mycobacterium ulcerans]|nr:hypothetical protein [Mycobacterium ulcerans]MEB4130026.1 hypothetical protein [Mycobacterium ulcerans]MEB4134169.1 hypothetical protein [Mycobacterium ulcerans]MEB4183840.1 hypothetical protein [Mycobacterium ulcerans]MEB4226117.1 hypothetical protein [Mycobacterium ulcerans]
PPPRPPQSTIPQLTSLLINNAGALPRCARRCHPLRGVLDVPKRRSTRRRGRPRCRRTSLIQVRYVIPVPAGCCFRQAPARHCLLD